MIKGPRHCRKAHGGVQARRLLSSWPSLESGSQKQSGTFRRIYRALRAKYIFVCNPNLLFSTNITTPPPVFGNAVTPCVGVLPMVLVNRCGRELIWGAQGLRVDVFRDKPLASIIALHLYRLFAPLCSRQLLLRSKYGAFSLFKCIPLKVVPLILEALFCVTSVEAYLD